MPALAVVGIVMGLVGGGISAYGQYQQGQAQKRMYNYQAAVAQEQARQAELTAATNVKLTQFQASQDAKQLRRKYSLVYGTQKASLAAQGISGSVTAEDIQTDTLNTEIEDLDNIRYNADLKSWNIKNQAAGEAWGLRTQANQFTYAGKNAAKAGTVGMAGTIFSTAGQAATSGYNFLKIK